MEMNAEMFTRWVRFVAERHRVYRRRKLERTPPPWTEDPILQAHRFTNVYRELDPGTTYLVREILNAERPEEEKLFNVMVYRLIGREATWARVGWITPWAYEPDDFVDAIRTIVAEGKAPWSNSYMVNSYHWTGYREKERGVAHVIGLLAEEWYATWESLKDRSMLGQSEEAHRILHAQAGWGGFLAYQALVDARYPRPDPLADWPDTRSALLPFPDANDGFGFAGPGALSGLKHLFGSGATQTRAMELTGRLHEALNEALGAAGFAFPENAAGEPVPLSRANVFNCLCEFHKYERLRSGKKGPLKYFQQREARERDLEEFGVHLQLELEEAIQAGRAGAASPRP